MYVAILPRNLVYYPLREMAWGIIRSGKEEETDRAGFRKKKGTQRDFSKLERELKSLLLRESNCCVTFKNNGRACMQV